MDPLIVDLYAGDGRTAQDITTLGKAGPPWHGVYLKATQGTTYRSDWFARNWALAHTQQHPDWFAGAYHYYIAGVNPKAQAHHFLREVRKAGGWFKNTLPMWVDLERAGQPQTASGRQVAEEISAFTECVKLESGRGVNLYAGEYLRELASQDKTWLQHADAYMGCENLIVAAYTETLPVTYYKPLGFNYGFGDHQLFGWQYCGDGKAKLKGYPHTTPLGPEDITAVTQNGGGDKALAYLRGPWPEVL